MRDMNPTTQKRTARVKLTLTKRTVETLRPADKPWIAWDDKLTGFGVRVQPSGTKAFVVNYRTGSGGRKAPNKRVVIGRYGRVAPDQARRLAQELLGRVAGGGDPAGGAGDPPRSADPRRGLQGIPGREPRQEAQHRDALPGPDALLPR